MGLSWVYTVVAAVAGLVVGGGDGFPAEDYVVRLAGQPEVRFGQYAGYVDLDDGKSLFYYFVEAEEDPDDKPLTLWLNGGPGCSSIGGGAFMELGPFTPTGDGRGLQVNSKSWNTASNLLFVESPVGVGWSYSNTSSNYSSNDASTANDMFIFMFRWFKKFPTFRTRELFLTGESYAGHYIPQLAIALLNHNEHTPDPFNLKGIALGNPLLKVDRDVPAVYEYLWSHGVISDEIKRTINNECDFESYSFIGTHNVSESCNDAIDEANWFAGNCTDIYGVIYDMCYPSLVEQELRLRKMITKMSFGVDVCKFVETDFYLNLPEVQKALHANRTNLPYRWSDCNDVHYNKKDGDINMLPALKTILESSVPVWIYSGDQDSVVPLLGSRTLVRELAHDLGLEITVPYAPWYHNGQVGGWTTEYGNLLTFATVRAAAHMVPYTQPSRALRLFTSFVRGRRLPNTTTHDN